MTHNNYIANATNGRLSTEPLLYNKRLFLPMRLTLRMQINNDSVHGLMCVCVHECVWDSNSDSESESVDSAAKAPHLITTVSSANR